MSPWIPTKKMPIPVRMTEPRQFINNTTITQRDLMPMVGSDHCSAIIPGQSEPVEARFSASGSVQPEDYQTDFLGPPSVAENCWSS